MRQLMNFKLFINYQPYCISNYYFVLTYKYYLLATKYFAHQHVMSFSHPKKHWLGHTHYLKGTLWGWGMLHHSIPLTHFIDLLPRGHCPQVHVELLWCRDFLELKRWRLSIYARLVRLTGALKVFDGRYGDPSNGTVPW